MFALLFIAAAAPVPQIATVTASKEPPVSAQQRATIRIVQGTSASAKDWDAPDGRNPAVDGQKHEVLLREADGRTIRLRLFEHE